VTEQEELPTKFGTGCVRRESQARFRENAGVKFPCVTRLAASVENDTITN